MRIQNYIYSQVHIIQYRQIPLSYKYSMNSFTAITRTPFKVLSNQVMNTVYLYGVTTAWHRQYQIINFLCEQNTLSPAIIQLFCMTQNSFNLALQALIVLSFYKLLARFSVTFIQLMFLTVILNFYFMSISLC